MKPIWSATKGAAMIGGTLAVVIAGAASGTPPRGVARTTWLGGNAVPFFGGRTSRPWPGCSTGCKRHEPGVEATEGQEGVEVLRVGDLDVADPAGSRFEVAC